MVPYYGDFAEDATVYIPFNTFSSDDPSASVTITNLADADIKVHKDGGTTQIATDGATIAIDYDSITGNHLITIDTSAHADYSTGSEYQVRVEGTTVDAATINAFIGTFSIERSGGVLALIKAGNLSANVVQISGDGTAADNLEAALDGTGGVTISADLDGSVGSVTGAINTAAGTITTLDGLDTAQDSQHSTTQSAISGLNDVSAADVNAQCDTAISDAALATATALATVDTVVDAVKAKTDSLTFGVAGKVDANITHVNEIEVTGDGASGTEWGPA